MRYIAVLMDFDGVIIDSSSLKTKLFIEFFARYPSAEREMSAYHYANKGISRYEQFDYLAKLLGEDEAFSSRLAAEFSAFAVEQVCAAPILPGALELLEILAKSGTPVHLVSNTPLDELSSIIAAKGLSRFFTTVHGSAPGKSKAANLHDILQRHAYSSEELVFIGDTLQDYTSAKAAGNIPFIGIANELTRFPQDVCVVDNLIAAKSRLGLE